MKKTVPSSVAGLVALLLLPTLLASPAQADGPSALAYSRVDTSFFTEAEMWTAAFSNDDSSLYFAENGSSGMRQISRTSLLSSGSPISASGDGFSSFRTSVVGWQNAASFAGVEPGKDGHYWIYSASGNCSVASGACSTVGAAGLWAINTSNNGVSRIVLKRANGQDQDGKVFAITGTPNGKYIYALAGKGARNSGNAVKNLFKIDALTNTQIGLGVEVSSFSFDYYLSADNNFVYSVDNSGNDGGYYLRIAIDGDSALNRTDSAAVRFARLPAWADSYAVQDNYLISTTWTGTGRCRTGLGRIDIVDTTTGAHRNISLAAGTYPINALFGRDGYLYAWDICSSKVMKVNSTTGQIESQTPAFIDVMDDFYWYPLTAMSHDKTVYVVGMMSAGGLVAVRTGKTDAEIAEEQRIAAAAAEQARIAAAAEQARIAAAAAAAEQARLAAVAAAELASRTVSAKNSFSAKALAQRTGVQIVSPKAAVTLSIAGGSKKICTKSGSKIKTVAAGNCVVSLTVQEPTPSAQKVTKSLVVGAAGSGATWKAKSNYSMSAVASSSDVARSSNAKLSMTVAKSSKGICSKSGSSLRMLKSGTCNVTFTVQEPKPAATKTTKTFVVN